MVNHILLHTTKINQINIRIYYFMLGFCFCALYSILKLKGII